MGGATQSTTRVDHKLPGQRPGEYLFLKRLNDVGIHPFFVDDPGGLQSTSIPNNCAAVFIWREGSDLKRLSASKLRSLGFKMSDRYEATIDANWSYFHEQEPTKVTSEHDSAPGFAATKITSDGCFEVSYASHIKCTVLGDRNLMQESKPNCVIRCFKLLLNLLLFAIHFLGEILLSLGKNAGAVTGFLKFFGVGFKFEIPEILTINHNPNDPIDYVKILCYGGIMVLLFYYGISKRSSAFAYRLSGAALLSSIVHFFWILFSPLPLSYCSCAISICVCFVLHGIASEAFLKVSGVT